MATDEEGFAPLNDHYEEFVDDSEDEEGINEEYYTAFEPLDSDGEGDGEDGGDINDGGDACIDTNLADALLLQLDDEWVNSRTLENGPTSHATKRGSDDKAPSAVNDEAASSDPVPVAETATKTAGRSTTGAAGALSAAAAASSSDETRQALECDAMGAWEAGQRSREARE